MSPLQSWGLSNSVTGPDIRIPYLHEFLMQMPYSSHAHTSLLIRPSIRITFLAITFFHVARHRFLVLSRLTISSRGMDIAPRLSGVSMVSACDIQGPNIAWPRAHAYSLNSGHAILNLHSITASSLAPAWLPAQPGVDVASWLSGAPMPPCAVSQLSGPEISGDRT
jgi:hypothetical protein